MPPLGEPMSSSKRLPWFAATVFLIAVFAAAMFAGRARHSSSVVDAAAAPDAGASGYHLIKTIKLGGEGFWDYLEFDSSTRRLFISRATKVIVLDVDSEKVVGEIPDTQGVHGIALAPDLGKGFTSNGGANTVTIFDLKTLQVLGTAKTDTGPDAITYDPATQRVFTMNGRSNDSTAIDAKSGDVVGTIPLDGRPESTVADGLGHVYVNLENKNEIVEIDSKKLAVMATWPVAPAVSPAGLAIDAKNRRLFSGCHNKMMAILDADTGKLITTEPIGVGVDADRFDPGTGFAFASTGSGVLSVIHEDSPDKFTFVEDVPTQQGARTMALDSKTHQVFLVTAQFTPPPAPTPDNPHPRGGLVPNSFVVLVFGR